MIAAIVLLLGLASSAAAAPLSALWIPEGPPDTEALQALLARHPELRLAVGVVAEELPASSTPTLAALWQEGRIEPVLRLAGDPILSLAPSAGRELRPRLAAARLAFQRAFGRAPEGFAPGGGALDAASAAAARATGLKWAAIAAEGSQPFLAGGLVAVPGLAVDPLVSGAEDALLVFDEGSGLAAPGSSLAAIDMLAERAGTARQWALPAAGLVPPPGSLDAGRSWAGDLSFWSGRPAQARALARLNEAAAALERYQNSGSASLTVLDKASGLLHSMEASRLLAQAEAREEEATSLAGRLYSLIGQRPPAEFAAAASTSAASGFVTVESSPGRIAFSNPEPPRPEAPACSIERLEVSFDEDAVAFSATIGSSDWPEQASLDVYVDINRRPGAGSQRLLPPWPGFLRASDAWDLAVSLSPEGASLRRFQRPGPPERYEAAWEPESRRVAASIPASRLRGRPGRWGYFAACAGASKDAPRLLAVLGSLEEQGQLLGPKPKKRPRFTTQRLTKTQIAVVEAAEAP